MGAWVKFDEQNFANFQEIFSNDQFFLRKDGQVEGNKVSLFVRLDDISRHRATSLSVPTVGVWHHIVGTWESGTLRIYFDGRLEASTQSGGALSSSPVAALIGAGDPNDRAKSNFSGAIDEIFIFNRALTTREIRAIFEAGDSGSAPP